MGVEYAQTTGTLQTNSADFEPIPGLTVTLPEGSDIDALVILNVPNPYAEGTNFPGGTFGLSVNGTVSPVTATFTYNEQQPDSAGRVPTTLVIAVPMILQTQTIAAVWFGVRGSNVVIDTPATLSATY